MTSKNHFCPEQNYITTSDELKFPSVDRVLSERIIMDPSRMEFLVEITITVILIYFVVKRKFDEYVAQFKDIPMLPIAPIIGHSLMFAFKTPSQILKLGLKNLKNLKGTALFIMGFNARIFITDPKDIEEILSNRKLIVKSDFYDYLKDWLGSGLIVSTGHKWATRRKIVTNSFHFKILEGFVEIFDKNSSVFVNNLKQFDGQVINVFPKIALCALDVICETAMGVKMNAQIDSESDYVKSVHK